MLHSMPMTFGANECVGESVSLWKRVIRGVQGQASEGQELEFRLVCYSKMEGSTLHNAEQRRMWA